MTGFYISAGYSSTCDSDEVEQMMFKVGREIANDPQAIVNEMAINGSAPWRESDSEKLMEYARRFKEQQDLTIEFETECPDYVSDKEEWTPQIKMLASGGGYHRIFKEESRRAFMRLLVNQMHRLGMDVNISVV